MDKYYRLFQEGISLARLQHLASQINGLESSGCYRDFAKSAGFCAEELKRCGARGVEIISLPADGETTYFDFIMPEAWDVDEAFLDIVEPGCEKRLCDLKESFLCVANRCAPTPEEGTRADLLLLEDAEKEKDLAGKMVFVREVSPRMVRDELVAKNVEGIVSSFSQGVPFPDSYYWINGWKTGPGWYHTKQDKKILCFSITARKGLELYSLLKQKGRVKVKALVKSRIYPGIINTVTGYLPGRTKQELLLQAHLYEPFITDNAIGAAALMEICRVLTEEIKKGQVPVPEKRIRFLMSLERYGFAQYLVSPARRNRITAAVNVDGIATDPAKSGLPVRIWLSPMSLPFFGDFVLEHLTSRYLPVNYAREFVNGNLSDDLWIADRTVGIPVNLVGSPPGRYHHNSSEREAVDWNLALKITSLIGTYVCLLTSGAQDTVDYIKEVTTCGVKNRLIEFYRKAITGALENPLAADLNKRREKTLFFFNYLSRALDTVEMAGVSKREIGLTKKEIALLNRKEEKKYLDLQPKQEENRETASRVDKKAGNMIISRKAAGIPFCLSRIPHKERKNSMPDSIFSLLNWADGRRDLAQMFFCFENEKEVRLSDSEKEMFTKYIRYLAKYGYLGMEYKVVLTKTDIKGGLSGLGIRPGDKVVVHSSLSGLGYVSGGPATVCEALMELITGEGVILMPSFNHYQPFEKGGPGYYSPVETPTVNGAVPEYFRKMPGVFRSLNPTHPFLAWGKNAREYVQNDHKLLTMGEGSPLHLLEKAGGKVILIDAFSANTFHHVVEMTNNVPCLGKRTEEYPVKLPGGRMVLCRTWGWRNGVCPISDRSEYLRFMIKKGLVREGQIGLARVLVFEMADCRKVLEKFLSGKMKGFAGCRKCDIKPRVNIWTRKSDWDEKKGTILPGTTAFVGDCPI